MTTKQSHQHPTESELKATKPYAIVALLVPVLAGAVLLVMLTLTISGVTAFHPATWVAVIFGGIAAFATVVIIGATRRTPTQRDRVVDRANQTLDDVDQIQNEVNPRYGEMKENK